MLGTRGARGDAYHLITPENHFASYLPDWRDTRVLKLVSPRRSPARFAQSLLELGPDGGTAGPAGAGLESFVYTLAGDATLTLADGAELLLGEGSFAYLPDGEHFELTAGPRPVLALWLSRRFEAHGVLGRPPLIVGHRDGAAWTALPTPGVDRQELLPPQDPRHDFNISILRFQPGAGLPNIEIHDEEHGLYMLAGEGQYHLDGHEHPVRADDFIYMAPYCPQGFVAGGPAPAEYLLYKDVFRPSI